MKHFFTLIILFLSFNFIQAQQCEELFISEYVEGTYNNKALEIYNPTPNAIDLSGYSLSRWSNGGTSASTTQLSGTIEPYSTFVVGLDKRDPNGEGLEAPMWDGNYSYIDEETGEEVILPYNEDYDLQSKIDLFVNPIYYTGADPVEAAANPKTLYFNGNDAVTLEPLGVIYPIDIFGKIGENPGDDMGWLQAGEDNWWTKDHTLIRKASVLMGETDFDIDVFDPSLEWDSLIVNTFVNLGWHDCDCDITTKLIEIENDFALYPNPTLGSKFTIQNNNTITNITIYNNLGRIVLSQQVHNVKQLAINLSNMKSGVYWVSIMDKHGVKNQSIVLR